MLNNLMQRFNRMQGNQNPVNASDVSDDLVSTPSTLFRVAAGTGTLVSGAATVATGLVSVAVFVASLSGTGARATGATEVSQLTNLSIATGAVSVQGMYSTAAATWVASASGTSTFTWMAVGT